jgi:RNA polymerase sigma-70 factor (ECF subfamily)
MEDVEADVLRLLEQARAGDEQAFDRLLARYRPELRAFVELRLGPGVRARVDPSDVVQEAQLEAFVRLPEYLERRPMPFPVWLRKTTYERLLKIRRHHEAAQRSVGREVALPEKSSVLLACRLKAAVPEPVQQLCESERAAQVQQALARLGEVDREVLLMRHVEELPYEAIGHVLDMAPATARKRYGRALLRLRKALSGADFEDSGDE